jgi:hypothetical protein
MSEIYMDFRIYDKKKQTQIVLSEFGLGRGKIGPEAP